MPKGRKLVEIDPDEISLVDAGANRKVFAIIKRSQTTMSKFLTVIASFLAAALTEPLKKTAEAIPETEANGLTEAVEAFAKYKDDLPDDILEAARTLLKAAISRGPEDGEGSEEPPNAIELEKIGARLSKATKEDLMKIKAVVDRMLEADKADNTPVKKYDGLPPEIVARLKKQDADEAAAQLEIKKSADAERAADKAKIAGLEARLDKLEKARGIKKSADVDGAVIPAAAELDLNKTDAKGKPVEKGKTLWPSLADVDPEA